MRAFVSLFAAVAIAMIVCGSAAWADKPVQSPISETITGQWVADCGDFLVLTDYRIEGFELRYYNDDGSSHWFLKVKYVDTVFYNANDPSYWLEGGAGEGSQNFVYFDENGEFINQVRTGVNLGLESAPGLYLCIFRGPDTQY